MPTNTQVLSTIIIGNINKVPPVNGTLSFSCQGVNLPEPGRRMAYCWHIHGGAYTSYFTYREAKQKGKSIFFNFYARDFDGTTKKVGSAREPYNIIGLINPSGTDGTKGNYEIQAPFTLRFEGNTANASLPDGSCTYNAGGTHFVLSDIKDSDPLTYINACAASNGDIVSTPQTKTDIPLNISVKTYCNISVSSDMLFPKQFELKKPVKTQAKVNTDCSAGTDYRVNIDRGYHYFDNMRHMAGRDGKESIAYSIVPEEWVGVGLGTPEGDNTMIDGTVPVQNTPSPGNYKDTLTVTVNIIR